MKKTTSICLFTGMIFLLLVMVVYLLFTQQDTGEKEQDLAAATEEMPAETDTEKELKTTESLAVYESYAYVIKQKERKKKNNKKRKQIGRASCRERV